MTSFKDRLNEAMRMRDMSAADLSRAADIREGAISQYRRGAYEASQRNLEKLAQALGVSIPWLMGADVPLPDNILPMPRMIGVPLVGTIACGEPILAEQNIEAVMPMPEGVKADFALRCKGDSMIGARIHDGDIVYIRQQPMVDDGQIAAVLIDDEATLKRVYHADGTLILQAENQQYKPMIYAGARLSEVRVLGLAVAFTSEIG